MAIFYINNHIFWNVKVVDWFGDLFGEGDYLDYEEDYEEVLSNSKWIEIIQQIFLVIVILLKETTTKKYYPDLSNESLSQRSIRKGLEILKRGTRRYQRHIFVWCVHI